MREKLIKTSEVEASILPNAITNLTQVSSRLIDASCAEFYRSFQCVSLANEHLNQKQERAEENYRLTLTETGRISSSPWADVTPGNGRICMLHNANRPRRGKKVGSMVAFKIIQIECSLRQRWNAVRKEDNRGRRELAAILPTNRPTDRPGEPPRIITSTISSGINLRIF